MIMGRLGFPLGKVITLESVGPTCQGSWLVFGYSDCWLTSCVKGLFLYIYIYKTVNSHQPFG